MAGELAQADVYVTIAHSAAPDEWKTWCVDCGTVGWSRTESAALSLSENHLLGSHAGQGNIHD